MYMLTYICMNICVLCVLYCIRNISKYLYQYVTESIFSIKMKNSNLKILNTVTLKTPNTLVMQKHVGLRVSVTIQEPQFDFEDKACKFHEALHSVYSIKICLQIWINTTTEAKWPCTAKGASRIHYWATNKWMLIFLVKIILNISAWWVY